MGSRGIVGRIIGLPSDIQPWAVLLKVGRFTPGSWSSGYLGGFRSTSGSLKVIPLGAFSKPPKGVATLHIQINCVSVTLLRALYKFSKTANMADVFIQISPVKAFVVGKILPRLRDRHLKFEGFSQVWVTEDCLLPRGVIGLGHSCVELLCSCIFQGAPPNKETQQKKRQNDSVRLRLSVISTLQIK